MSDVQIKSVKTFAGLEWLIEEIENSLNAAFSELEAFTQNTSDETKIHFCIGHLHQIIGPFKILECEGCILLVEEMEALTQAIIDKKVSNINEACEILVHAIVKLPIYLRQILSSREDRPESLILLLNDLRAAQGQSLISEGILFSPDLSAFKKLAENQIRVDSNPATSDVIKRLRQVYQLSLIKLIKGQEKDANYANLKKVLRRVGDLSKGTWRESLWHAARQVLGLIAAGEITFSIALKKLFRALDTQLKIQAKEAISGEICAPNVGLLKNLLYYLTTIQPGSVQLQAIWHDYNLANAFPSGTISPELGQLIPQYDPLVVRSLVTAIQGELANVRSALERFSVEGGLSADEVRETLPVLTNMADSLALVGQGKLRDAISNIDKKLRKSFAGDGSGINDQDVTDAVQSLAEIELALNTWAASPDKFSGTVDLDSQQNQFEFDSASQALLAESRTGIERIKEAVVAFINSQWDLQLLSHLPQLFAELQGALRIIGLSRAASVVGGCGKHVENMISGQGREIEWHTLDTFADAITIVEYYLERFHSETDEQQDDVLTAAEESIHALLAEDKVDHSAGLTQQTDNSADELHAEPEEILAELVSLEQQEPFVAVAIEDAFTQHSDAVVQQETSFAEDEEDVVDAEIIEIFVEEADEVLESLRTLLPDWKNQLEDKDLLITVRRSFHTLKGSGRMVGATDLGNLAWSLEEMLNHVIDGRVNCSDVMVDLVEAAIQSFFAMVKAFAEQHPIQNPERISRIVEVAKLLAGGERMHQLPTVLLEAVAPGGLDSDSAPTLENHSEVLDTGIETPPASCQKENVADKDLSEGDDHEAILLEIFVNEAQDHLKTIDDFVIEARSTAPIYQTPPFALQRALHTLKGTAEMADFSDLGDLVTPIEEFIKELHHHHICLDEDIVHLVENSADYIRYTLVEMTDGVAEELAGLPMFRARLAELREKAVGHLVRKPDSGYDDKDFSAVKRLMAQGLLSLQDYPALYDYLQHQTAPPRVIFNEFVSDLNAILDQLVDQDIAPILQLAELMNRIYELLLKIGMMPDQEIVDSLKDSHENLLNLFDMLAADQDLVALSESEKNGLLTIEEQLTQRLAEKVKLSECREHQSSAAQSHSNQPIELVSDYVDEVEPRLPDEDQPSAPPEFVFTVPEGDITEPLVDMESTDIETEPAHPQVSEPESETIRSTSLVDTELDNEIVGVFVEEADDIVSHIEELVMAWRSSPTETEFADRLKRDLHTLKGGARMAGFGALGDRAHAIESLIDETKIYDKRFFKAAITQQEKLVSAYDIIRQIAHSGDSSILRKQIDDLENETSDEQSEEEEPTSDSVPGFVRSPTLSEQTALATSTSGQQQIDQDMQRPGTTQPAALDSNAIKGEIKEVVRIGAEVLDTLVNLSGENIIFRGRVEEQLSEFNQFLDEMDATVDRLQGQVRRLGTETEAQIDYRREQIESSGEAEGFDPLEMDRYSHLQQLTGSLMESASDLRDLKETLNEKLISTETLLLHQSRINTDLQEGLMKTRMVPFARIVPRLRRIVRQVSMELGKKVDLRMDNIQGEMDRSVLDRMIAPLEHMIRNAVDHGIEAEAERLKVGKPATGSIAITTFRQGGDIVIHLADDGRGLNVEKIRQIALERDLIPDDAALSEYEIAQFIFHPGFSTSDSISQISGRGVGLDVVNSEVRQCGGRVDIETSTGFGAQFTIVLPFTLSVNRALMINVTGDHYALSLNSIDGVHFMPLSAVDAALSNGSTIHYAGIDYELCYLGSLLDPEITKRPESLDTDAALVLFHSDNRRFAVQVDEILGTREIVVKTLGSQFSSVPGLGGATILSDGQVVVIIDLNELARVAIVDLPRIGQVDGANLEYDARLANSNEISPSILVVDDSVTVRKVTSRILRRQGYRVLTAKDGVEALKTLQEELPKVILLDIEMPRMDGFEVASRVRENADLCNIPIIMITSRTGDKHRQRAMELGVDYYMGKPFQEEKLLETLSELLAVQN